MDKNKSFGNLFEEAKKDDSYWSEKAILKFSIELHNLMKKRGLSKKDFANKLKKSQAYITKIFRGNANFTIETMIGLTRALDGELSIHVTPKEEKIINWFKIIDGKKRRKPLVADQAWCNNIKEELQDDFKMVVG